MSILFKMARVTTNSLQMMPGVRQISTLLTKKNTNPTALTATTNTPTTAWSLFFNEKNCQLSNQLNPKRLMYTFRLSNKLVRNTHATRPRKTKNNSVELTYEQAQFAENLGVTKSWNSWNTCM